MQNTASEVGNTPSHHGEQVASSEAQALYMSAARLVVVRTEACDDPEKEEVSKGVKIFWKKTGFLFLRWKKCIGFSMYLPAGMDITEDTPARAVVERAEALHPGVFGKYRQYFYCQTLNLRFTVV
jgi:hypothetical protein